MTTMLTRYCFHDFVSRRFLSLFAALCFVTFAADGMAAGTDAPRRPWDGTPGFCRIPGTVSPDGRYVVIWAPAGLSQEDRATLPEWASDLDINCEKTEIEDFLYDTVRGRVAADLSRFDYFEGQGWRKNRGAVHVAWTADSRKALVIFEERWDDQGIVWIDSASGRVTDLKDVLEKAYLRVLRQREKENDHVAIQFSEPAILPGNVLVVDGNAGHMKEGPYYDYRLTFRVTLTGKHPQLELVKARKIPESEEHTTGTDYDPDLNTYYKRLRSGLDENGRSALKKEEEEWIKFRDAQPADARDDITRRRMAELRARIEN